MSIVECYSLDKNTEDCQPINPEICSDGSEENAELGKPGECRSEDDIQCPPIRVLPESATRDAAYSGNQ